MSGLVIWSDKTDGSSYRPISRLLCSRVLLPLVVEVVMVVIVFKLCARVWNECFKRWEMNMGFQVVDNVRILSKLVALVTIRK